ncbi:MAG TPA: DUF881 domain-containing protein [Candidatus Limnocylindria bacterium]|nr:DUF881 domain-containing protein [Candidatus Limnocylindria bacterium]
MSTPLARFSLALIAFVIGLALVAQFRSQARPTELTSLPVAELSTRIQTLSDANGQLRTALAEQRSLLAEYQAAGAQGSSALDVSREELRRIRAYSGLAPVEGQGIILRVSGALDAIAVNDLVNELRNAGAEALAVDETRLTARSVVVEGARTLEIDGAPIGRTFTLGAIGDPDGLVAALQRPGGIVAQLEQFVSATITITQTDTLRLPATEADLVPEAATPVE